MWFKLVALSLVSLLISTGLIVVLSQVPDQWLHVIACDVGQGDGILIISGATQVLIDAGPDEKILSCLQQYLPFWDRNLELVVATHADHDHIGGMPAVYDHFQVTSLLLTAQTKNNADFRDFRQAVRDLNQKGTVLLGSRQGRVFSLAPGISLTTVFPEEDQAIEKVYQLSLTETQLSAYLAEEEDKQINSNDGSIVLFLQFNEFSFLTTGDLGEAGEQTLTRHHLIKDIDVLKAGHHGSKTSSSAVFLAETRPEFTLISCGQNNSYGHPHSEVLRRLEIVGSQIMRTDQLGHIELQTDGQRYWFFHHR